MENNDNLNETVILRGISKKYHPLSEPVKLEEILKDNPDAVRYIRNYTQEAICDKHEEIRIKARNYLEKIGRGNPEEDLLNGAKILMGFEKLVREKEELKRQLYLLLEKEEQNKKDYCLVDVSEVPIEFEKEETHDFEFEKPEE